MHITKVILLIILLLTIYPLRPCAQTGKLFDTDNQLSSNFVNEVFQDQHGFIWIATRNGLNVYDGYRFTIFDKSTDGLTSGFLTCFADDSLGHVLIGSNLGLSYHDSDGFHVIPLYDAQGQDVSVYIKHLLRLRNGDVLISTSGFGVLRMHTLDEARVMENLASLPHVMRTYEDSDSRIWIVTEEMKLYRLEPDGQLTDHFDGLRDLSIMDVQEDANGTLYVATRQDGIFMKRTSDKEFHSLPSTAGLTIHAITILHDHELYIATDGQGVHVLDLASLSLTDNPFFSRQTDLSRTKILNIMEDQQGNIWFSMLQKGLFMQPRNTQNFAYMGFRLGSRNTIGEHCVNDVLIGSNGNMWVGTDQDGLYQLDANGALIRHHTAVPATVMALCEDREGRIWIGSYLEGCGYLDQQGAWHPVDILQGGGVNVFDIVCGEDGTMWLGTLGDGLVRLSTDGTQKNYRAIKGAGTDETINSLPNDFVTQMALSRDGSRLYVGTCFGLACMDIEKESWTSVYGTNSLNHGSYSVSVFSDNAGRVWYSTNDSIFCYEPSCPQSPKHYGMANGLPSNAAASFSEDAKGRIWIGTPHGLCCLNPLTQLSENYYVENGMQSNEFSDRAVSVSKDGSVMLFGGTGGINWFNPMQVSTQKWTAKVTVDDSLLGNRFDFDHDESSFTLRLTTLSYGNVEQIAYAYSINGEQWRTTLTGQNEITFSHLPAGDYHFRVKAINNGQESPETVFTITIHPAWYASTWAKLFYLCLLILIIYLYFRHRKRKEQDRLLLQQHIHAEEMGEAKIRFFMNISHEIRTPLTLIISPLLTLIKEDRDPHRQSAYALIHKNAERILNLVSQMLDLRKIDKGQMAMRMSETDLIGFAQNQYQLFLQQAEAKHITFSFKHDCDTLPIWIDRGNFDKVLMNVLSNAFKFTPDGGQITLGITHTPHHAYISVKDSGCGIPPDKLETIFQRFYQSTGAVDDRNIGTGIGLDLARSLTELHYGTITARNNDDKGAEFIIRLPLGCGHLSDDEKVTEKSDEPSASVAVNPETVASPVVPEPSVAPMVPEGGVGNVSIVIVEDEEDIRRYLTDQFSPTCRVSAFSTAREALPEIIRQQPSLVISDVMMPEMNGNELCRLIKGNINTNQIPVILLTAKSSEEDELEGLEMGADAYITKPFSMEILRRTVANLLAVRHTLKVKFSGQESQHERTERIELQSADEKLLDRIMQVINENIDNPDLSVDMIADKVGISRVHLHHKMKELTNQTPHNFIRNVRLRLAAELLKDSRQTISDVMYACGFSNAASFSTMFKVAYGCSPREYMKNVE